MPPLLALAGPLLPLAGPRLVERFGGWSRGPFSADAPLQLCVREPVADQSAQTSGSVLTRIRSTASVPRACRDSAVTVRPGRG
ncbi:hypothetical protein [Actinoplanes rectilineatus]|uniref:hypothetical protein n=1 Tax=Actinoplanes rectilineatus TaxID=113571 RepID=UPI00146FF756|nr:hypothetical protein [Actinoplanes rectilineatus]